MAFQPKVLAFAGSLRRGSYNKKLIRVAARGAQEAGAAVTLIDLRDYPLPIYDGDLEDEAGLPDNARRLKDLFNEHHGLLISAPEYNSSISAALKNTIDWASRKATPDEPPLQAFDAKVAGLVSASTGALGGLRGLVHVRAILGNIKVLVLPQQYALSKAQDAFDDNDQLKDDAPRKAVESIGRAVAETIAKLHG